MTEPDNLTPFDPARMRLNRAGRAYWTNPPEGLRRGLFVTGVDPDSLPAAPARKVAPPPAPEPEPAQKAPPIPREPTPPPAAAPPPNPAGLADELGGVPLPQISPAPEPEEGAEPAAPAGEPEELPASASALPAIPGEPEPPGLALSSTEVAGLTTMHELLINRFVATVPRRYTPQEREDVGAALGGALARYGGSLGEHAPLVNLGFVTAVVAMERTSASCEACGEKVPGGAIYCSACGGVVAANPGGPCVNPLCKVELHGGEKFCLGCGVRQAPASLRPRAVPSAASAAPDGDE